MIKPYEPQYTNVYAMCLAVACYSLFTHKTQDTEVCGILILSLQGKTPSENRIYKQTVAILVNNFKNTWVI